MKNLLKIMKKKLLPVLFIFLLSNVLFSQKDSLKLGNDEILIGEIQSMDQSVLIFKTSFSDSDFKIKWRKVKEVYSKRFFIISLSDGSRFNSSINTDSIDKKHINLIDSGEKISTDLNKVTSLDPFESSFFKRLLVAIDAGFSSTKANNFQQLTANGKFDYKAFKWNFLTEFSLVYSRQDNTDNISRYEANINAQRFLPKEWYLSSGIDLLSNSDQKLKLRTTGSLGVGYFIKKNNNLYFGTGAGLAYNNETYTDVGDSKSSLESYVSTDFNKYDIGDFSILTSATLSPSITESGRVRFDYKFSLKYDLTSSIYLKSSLTYNYDNQPVQGASKGDYTFQITVGWDND